MRKKQQKNHNCWKNHSTFCPKSVHYWGSPLIRGNYYIKKGQKVGRQEIVHYWGGVHYFEVHYCEGPLYSFNPDMRHIFWGLIVDSAQVRSIHQKLHLKVKNISKFTPPLTDIDSMHSRSWLASTFFFEKVQFLLNTTQRVIDSGLQEVKKRFGFRSSIS